ncbi:unnamed protein product [Angiostrongylus costaricensis]|uniref:WH2 domain-containing protein n=1 Tax=Angiostrongylus costaricensis TaxID=334426 RepID=A0A0R3Q290_ANGCS|nr:unnamed protein product [Angiostrongylus costaricensis]
MGDLYEQLGPPGDEPPPPPGPPAAPPPPPPLPPPPPSQQPEAQQPSSTLPPGDIQSSPSKQGQKMSGGEGSKTRIEKAKEQAKTKKDAQDDKSDSTSPPTKAAARASHAFWINFKNPNMNRKDEFLTCTRPHVNNAWPSPTRNITVGNLSVQHGVYTKV